jgi:glucose/arabinose dehydrogenase
MSRVIGVVFLAALFAVPLQAQTSPRLSLERIAQGLTNPLGVVAPSDGSLRLFFVEQRGRIKILQNGAVSATPFLDLSSEVSCCGERGLLGLALHPAFASNGRFFVNYTDLSGNTVVASYRTRGDDPNRADLTTRRVILQIAQPFSNHNGGHLAFGPDGFLYIATGDGGSGGDPGNRAQNLSDLLGKILRIDVDSTAQPYTIPAGNPFVGVGGARPEVWAYGLRNPWRFSFDRDTGDLWIADVGQNQFEEVDFQPAASRGGENYGWRRMEGLHCFNPATGCNDGSLVLPVFEYARASGCSVTGGFRYRGFRSPVLRGLYFFGDYCSGRVWGASFNGSTLKIELELSTGFAISSFGEDETGELLIVDHGGAVYRLHGRSGARPRPVRR